MNFYVYALVSLSDKSTYVGLTRNLKIRIKEHRDGLSAYTKGHLPYKFVFTAVFPDKFIAAKFENYLKTASGKAFLRKRLIS